MRDPKIARFPNYSLIIIIYNHYHFCLKGPKFWASHRVHNLIQQVHESDLFQGFPYNWCADFMHLCQDFGGFPTILGEWETSHSSIWENQHDGPMIWAHGKCPKSIRKTPMHIPSSIHNWQGLSNAQIWFRFKHFSSTPFGTSKWANKNGHFWTVAAEFQPPTKETTFYCNPRNEGVGNF